MALYLRGDSGFAVPELYELLEHNSTAYAIRLKVNKCLYSLAESIKEELDYASRRNKKDYCVVYGEFDYQAGSWAYPRRVVVKVEKPTNQFTYQYTFIVTNMSLTPEKTIQFYCNRGTMENFIKESKNGFNFDTMSSHGFVTNANKLQLSMLTYNLFNWFRRLAIRKSMSRYQVDTIRLKLIKIAARVVHGAGYIIFKLCSSCAYKKEFMETLFNIHQLHPKLE